MLCTPLLQNARDASARAFWSRACCRTAPRVHARTMCQYRAYNRPYGLVVMNDLFEHHDIHRGVMNNMFEHARLAFHTLLPCCSAGSLNRSYNQAQHSIYSHGSTTACLSGRTLQLKLTTLVHRNIVFLKSIVLGNSNCYGPYTSPIYAQQSAVAIHS